jgi:predicted AlkP superfamily phosphohydrolase/phosphomutase
VDSIEVKGVVAEHGIEELYTLMTIKAHLTEITHIALQHIVEDTGIFGCQRHAGDKGVGCKVTIAYIQPGAIHILIIGREAQGTT